MTSRVLAPMYRVWFAAAIVGVAVTAMLIVAGSAARAQVAPDLPASVEAAVRTAAATEAGVAAEDVQILRADAVTWNDGCLGAQATDEVCLQALVDGYVVWALTGSTVHRFHTDTTSSVRLGQSGIAVSSVTTAPLPSGATARPIQVGVISGDIPSSGYVMFQVTGEVGPDAVRAELQAKGCVANTLAKTVSGRWYIYGFDSPDFANAPFFEANGVATGVVPADSILLANCQEAPQPSPFSTDDVDKSARSGVGALADIEVGDHPVDGFERIVFEFADEFNDDLTLSSGVPAYTVGYETSPAACGSGLAVDIDGEALLVINLPTTFSYDPEAGTSLVSEPGLASVQSIVSVDQSCAFEGVSTWVFGIDSEAGFRISELSSPTRLVIDIETATVVAN